MINLIELLKNVTEGVSNSIVLNEAIEEISQERLAICKGCEFYSTPGKLVNNTKCKACGCFLKLKTRVPSASCGLKEYNAKHPEDIRELKWLPVADYDTENKINDLI